MNLVIDIGNTSTKLAVFDGDNVVDFFTEQGQSINTISKVCSSYAIRRGIVCSVVDIRPDVSEQLRQSGIPFLFLDRTTPIPVTNLYETPETLGYDRIAAVVGAYNQCPGRNILVIDAGTAITYEFIDAKGQYHGGNISPGIQVRLRALNHYTGHLPLVDAAGELPHIGRNTETAIRAGVLRGIEYEIRGYISSLKHKYPELLVFLTGGDDFSFATNLKNNIFADRFLVLKGLNRILNYKNDKI